MTKHIRGYTL
uniref:Uncharacterized protein n=1 Tax=Lepeophtheirus salmonis TaxID=72036 RepID=A0A0K2V3B0_LEPSM